jgi:lipopolysaccharide cholinephosphotransferase
MNTVGELLTLPEPTDSVLPRTDPAVVARIYGLLEIFAGLAERNRIDYWLSDGTLLGAVRHGGLIPWDDDADLQFFEEDERRIRALREPLLRAGCGFTSWWGGYKIFLMDGQPVRWHRHRFPFVDLFPVRRARNGRVAYARWRARFEWPRFYFLETELLPLTHRPFGPLHLPCPREPSAYLARGFGHDWETVAHRTFDHAHERKIEPLKVRLTNRSPAEYGESRDAR